jgi:hypothetical protein
MVYVSFRIIRENTYLYNNNNNNIFYVYRFFFPFTRFVFLKANAPTTRESDGRAGRGGQGRYFFRALRHYHSEISGRKEQRARRHNILRAELAAALVFFFFFFFFNISP